MIHQIDVATGTIDYEDVGSGPTLVFVHGILANGGLWNEIVSALKSRFRCIVLTLPLGAHRTPMPAEADLSPFSIARVIADVIEKLNLYDVTLIGNDTGGALCQLVIARYPERIARLVLTNCDAFECFPPLVLSPLFLAARLPGFSWVIAQGLRSERLQRLFVASVARAKPSAAFLGATFKPFVTDSRVRRDLQKMMRAVSSRDTQIASHAFASFPGRVLIAWGTDDLFFPVALARRLARAFPNAELRLIEGSRTFVPQDDPVALVTSLEEFFASPATA